MKDYYKATRQHVNLFSRQLVINKTGLKSIQFCYYLMQEFKLEFLQPFF